MTKTKWRIRLGREAERDFERILAYTAEAFGVRQFEVYQAALIEALAALDAGPMVLGSNARDDILPGLRMLHIARQGRRGRHFIMYRVSGSDVIEVIENPRPDGF